MSSDENIKLSAVIKIVNFPWGNEIIDYFKSFMKNLLLKQIIL